MMKTLLLMATMCVLFVLALREPNEPLMDTVQRLAFTARPELHEEPEDTQPNHAEPVALPWPDEEPLDWQDEEEHLLPPPPLPTEAQPLPEPKPDYFAEPEQEDYFLDELPEQEVAELPVTYPSLETEEVDTSLSTIQALYGEAARLLAEEE